MSKTVFIALVFVSAFVNGVVAFPKLSAQQQTAPAPIVFDGVTVIDVQQGRRIPAQRVVIMGTRIKTIGSVSTVAIPSGAQVVDAKGKYMIPGLWDMHVHPMRLAHIFYPLFIANGVTGIRDAGSAVPLDTLMLWRREILAGTRVGPPRQILSGQSIGELKDEKCERKKQAQEPETCVADSADARHYVDSIKAAGADMIKPRAVKQAMYYVIAAESRRLKIPFGGHTDDGQLPMDVSDSGASIVDHLSLVNRDDSGLFGLCWASRPTANQAQCQQISDRFKRNGTWFAPTLARYYYNLSSPGVTAMIYGDVPDSVYNGFRAFWENEPQTVKDVFRRFQNRAKEFWGGSLLHGNWLRDSVNVTNSKSAAGTASASPSGSSGSMRIIMRTGLPILAGTDDGAPVLKDMPPGFSLLTELAMYVSEGMTPLEALRTATLNPAKLLHATDSLGTVSQGKLADLVLLDADPLTDITNVTTVRAVVANGRYFDRTSLDKLLVEAQAMLKNKTQK